ncbi:MAG: ATP-binding protein [Bacteroidota bacterium]|nr:ATP-binding protein [Bacteroidota bacterium]
MEFKCLLKKIDDKKTFIFIVSVIILLIGITGISGLILNIPVLKSLIPGLLAIQSLIFLSTIVSFIKWNKNYHKSSEFKREQAEEEYRIILQTAIDGFYIIDTIEGRFLDVNDAFCTITGYSKEELLKMRISDLEIKENQEEIIIHFQKIIKEGWERFETRYRHKNGSIFDVTISANFCNIQGGVFIIFLKDITEKKKTQEILKKYSEELEIRTMELHKLNESLIKSEKSYRSLFDNMLNGFAYCKMIFENDTPVDFIYLDVNNSFEELTGLKNVTGKKVTEVVPGIKESNPELFEIYGNVSLTGKPYQFETYSSQYRGWRYITVYSPEKGYFAVVFENTTERKNYETRLEKYNNDLKRSNEELENFAYVASHDLQEPLRMVSSFTQLLDRKYAGSLDNEAHEYINFAVDGANRMQQLINDLLDYSRIKTKAKPFEAVDCNIILGRVRAFLNLKITENSALITNDELPTVIGDENQLTRLFQNIIENGIKFRRNISPLIHISAKDERDYWLFSISDNGIGIDPEFKNKVFVIFKRLHSRTDYPGTGIGLAICKKIVEQHNGQIWFESEPGKGTTFFFTIKK